MNNNEDEVVTHSQPMQKRRRTYPKSSATVVSKWDIMHMIAKRKGGGTTQVSEYHDYFFSCL